MEQQDIRDVVNAGQISLVKGVIVRGKDSPQPLPQIIVEAGLHKERTKGGKVRL
jgi:hypothetical protein